MAEEEKLQSKILKDLRSWGKKCVCFKIMKTSDNGIPDIYFTTATTGGVFIEAKKYKGAARKLQDLKIKRIIECGTKAFVCDSWECWVNIKSKLGLCIFS